MKVQVENLDSVRRKVEVLLPRETIAAIREGVYDEIKKHAKIKGFRPGKTPKAMITQYYKDYIDEEVKKKMVEGSMFAALMEAKVDPITEPLVDFIEKDGEEGYALECEVLPEIVLPEYKGVEVEVESLAVTDDEIDKRMENLRQMHAEIVARPGDAVARSGDFAVIKYQAYHDGQPLKDVASDSYPIELGNAMLMPEFENALVGMKEGEEKDVEVPFAADYPDKSIAGKTLLFKIVLKEVKEKRLPELNDDFAKDLSYIDLEGLKAATQDQLGKEKETTRDRDVTQKILETLLKDLDVPVPARLLEKRIQGMVEETMSRYQSRKIPASELEGIEERLKGDYAKGAQERLKTEIVLARIAEKEAIKADEKDVEERLKKIAAEANKTYNEMKSLYEQYNMIGGLRSSIVEEKTISFLRENAVLKEKA